MVELDLGSASGQVCVCVCRVPYCTHIVSCFDGHVFLCNSSRTAKAEQSYPVEPRVNAEQFTETVRAVSFLVCWASRNILILWYGSRRFVDIRSTDRLSRQISQLPLLIPVASAWPIFGDPIVALTGESPRVHGESILGEEKAERAVKGF